MEPASSAATARGMEVAKVGRAMDGPPERQPERTSSYNTE